MSLRARLKRLEQKAGILEMDCQEQTIRRQFMIKGIDPDDFDGWLRSLSNEKLAEVQKAMKYEFAKLIDVDAEALPDPSAMSDEELSAWSIELEQIERQANQQRAGLKAREASLVRLQWWLDLIKKGEATNVLKNAAS